MPAQSSETQQPVDTGAPPSYRALSSHTQLVHLGQVPILTRAHAHIGSATRDDHRYTRIDKSFMQLAAAHTARLRAPQYLQIQALRRLALALRARVHLVWHNLFQHRGRACRCSFTS